MGEHVEFIINDLRLGSVAWLERGFAECFPHIHNHQTDFARFFRPEPAVELVQTGLRTVLAAKPDGAAKFEIANHDPIAMTRSDSNFIDADERRRRRPGKSEL